MGGSSGGGGTTTSSNKAEFADEQKPYIEQIFKQAQQGYGQVAGKTYTGPTMAANAPEQEQALNMARTLGLSLKGFGDSTNTSAGVLNNGIQNGTYTNAMNGSWTDPNSAALLQGAIAAGTDPIKRQLLQDVLPGLSSAAIEGGAYGGSKFQDLQSKAIRGFTDQATNIGADLAYRNYNDSTNRTFQDAQTRLGLTPALLNAQTSAAATASSLKDSAINQNLAGSNILQQVGDTQQGYEQAKINDLIARYQQTLKDPFTGLDTYASFINGFGNPLSQSGTSVQQKAGGGFAGGAKGALGGAATGAAIGSIVPGLGTAVGAGVGGVLGGLGGFF